MKKNILLIAGFVLAFTAVSCSLEENAEPVVDSVVPMEFTADAAVTKTAITDDNAVIWSEGDAISVFDGAGYHKFTAGTAGSTTTKFSGEAESGKETYYALYPYSADASLAGTTIHSVLPANQYSTADGTFDTMLAPAVAKAEENGNLTFVNVAGLVKFTFTGAGDRAVKSISMTADQSLTGSYSVDMSGEEFSAVATASASVGETPAVSGITLTAKEGNLAAGPYYLVALPGTYSNVKISVVLSDGAKLNGSVGTLDIMAGKIKPTTIDLTEVQPTLYDKFMAGEDIEIAGKVYNKAKFGDAQLITENTELTTAFSNNTAAIFIEGDVVLTWSLTTASKNVMIVGNDPDKKSKVVLNQYIRCNAGGDTDAEFVMYNVDVDATQYTNNYLIFNNTSIPTSFRVIDSKLSIGDQRVFRATNDRAWNIIEFSGSTVNVTKSTTRPLIHADGSTGTFTNIIFRNNVLYSASGIVSTYNIFNSSGEVTVEKVVMENNTIINLHDEGAGLFRNYEYLNEVELKNNLLYVDEHATNAEGVKTDISFFRPLAATQIVQSEDDPVYVGNPEKGICDKSYFFVKESSDSNLKRTWFFGGMTRVNLTNETEFESVCGVDPFVSLDIDNENFDVKDEYASYGAQR